MDKRTKALFEWAASKSSASTETDAPTAPSTSLDPSIIDAILGPNDATLMLDSMKAIKDVRLPLDDRITAFDNLELLVEQIDNASNLESLKLWPPLLSMLSSPEPQLRRYAAWVTGTAVQNNPKAQGHLLQYKGVKKLVEKLDDEYSVRTKVLYAVGSELNHFPAGIRQFRENDGWKKLRKCVNSVEEGTECQRRVAFFVANYLAEEGVETEEIEKEGFLDGFVDILGDEKTSNESDLLDKVRPDETPLIQTVQAVSMLVTKRIGTSNTSTISKLKQLLPKLDHKSIDQDMLTTLETSLKSL